MQTDQQSPEITSVSPHHAERDSSEDANNLLSGDDRSENEADDARDLTRNAKRKRPISVSYVSLSLSSQPCPGARPRSPGHFASVSSPATPLRRTAEYGVPSVRHFDAFLLMRNTTCSCCVFLLTVVSFGLLGASYVSSGRFVCPASNTTHPSPIPLQRHREALVTPVLTAPRTPG